MKKSKESKPLFEQAIAILEEEGGKLDDVEAERFARLEEALGVAKAVFGTDNPSTEMLRDAAIVIDEEDEEDRVIAVQDLLRAAACVKQLRGGAEPSAEEVMFAYEYIFVASDDDDDE